MKKIRYALLIALVVITFLVSTISAFAWTGPGKDGGNPNPGPDKGATGGGPPGWSQNSSGSGGSGTPGAGPQDCGSCHSDNRSSR